jgi:hypothetical protein
MILYSCTIFLGAFLLFLVQPIIAKQILPWFGGSAAVWATCMVFFQIALLAGYTYADWTTRHLSAKRQALLHGALLAVSLLALPIIPGANWKPSGTENPSVLIIGLLTATIGLPYFLLATTSPLVQAWFARRFHHTMPYRLFALSNFASLLALLSYPVAIEPWIASAGQSMTWSTLYVAFALLAAAAAYVSLRGSAVEKVSQSAPAASACPAARPGAGQQLQWLALAALGSFMLLAVTNHICQNVASIPFLWIVPLSLYLVSFILCFDHPRWYVRPAFLLLTAALVPVMAWLSDSLELHWVVPVYMAGMFCACMFCHGELSRAKPDPVHLTTYYLMISLGGALGGLLVGFGAPYLLKGYFEIQIGLVACGLLLAYRTWKMGWWAIVISAAVVGTTGWFSWNAVDYQIANARVMRRNFYSAVRTRESQTPVPFRSLVHGGIVHGGQLRDPDKQLAPSSYFGSRSGFGRLFAALPDDRRRVGVIGLGAGSIAAYARKGDLFRFYEINPQVIEIAHKEFTFLDKSPGKMEVVLGDGRLSLEREHNQQFDVLAIDAFSGDSIPMHLLTREAMLTYMRHLKPGGVLAFQATNRFVSISPVVERLAAEFGLTAVLISDSPEDSDGANYWLSGTDQILATRNKGVLENKAIRSVAESIAPSTGFRVWTDDFNNLLRILK